VKDTLMMEADFYRRRGAMFKKTEVFIIAAFFRL
jgi:hypothetical protein